MADVLTPEQRKKNMSNIKGRNTAPERILRSLLSQEGYRFRLHDKKLPGHPDIVMKRYRAVILVHGCFWHRHPGCRYATMPKSNTVFWQAKFSANQERDARNIRQLTELNWNVIIVWECQIRTFQKEGVRFIKEVLTLCEKENDAKLYEIDC